MQNTAYWTALLVLACSLVGCERGLDLTWLDPPKQRSEPPAALREPLPEAAALAQSAAFQDTVGSVAYIEGQRGMRVRGYGIVAGLARNGSRECPDSIRKLLIAELEKEHGFGLAHEGLADLPPEKIIDDLDTAVVEVVGTIPAAASKGARFDAYVAAVARSERVSLAGGRLYTCDLKLYESFGSGPMRAGPRLAVASGPIFVNPFRAAQDDGNGPGAPAGAGHVLGGGVVVVPRRLRLRLIAPSYKMAYEITARLNQRFGHEPKTAEALSPAAIQLHVPPRFWGREADFVNLVLHLYVGPRGEMEAMQAGQLAREIVDPSAPHARIAWAWECLGPRVLPTIQELYTHEQPHVRYFAARTGIRLRDNLAVEVLTAFARDVDSPFHRAAINDLGATSHLHAATEALKPLLDHDDPRVRVAAYEALVGRPANGIRSFQVGEDNFVLDVVPSTGPGLIWAKAAGERRMAVFGEALACRPPVFYVHPDRAVYINARQTDEQLTLVRRGRFAPTVSPPIPAPLSVPELIRKLGDDPLPDAAGEIRGLAMSYDQVILIMHHMCEDNTIPARFMFDRPSITDLFGPIRPEGRPETDL